MYQYKAYAYDKRIAEGIIDATSEETAEERLLEAGYRHVLALKKTRPRFSLEGLFHRFSGVNKTEIIELFYQLAILIDSRMPIVQALRLLAEQAPKASLKDIVYKIGHELAGGISLSQALTKYPHLISAQYCQVISVSEKSGELSGGLKLVADYMEKETNTVNNIRHMLSYPAFLGIMAVVVIIILSMVAVPSLIKLFTSLGVDLPLQTRLLVSTAGFITDYIFHLVVGLISLGIFTVLFIKSSVGKRFLDLLTMKLPVIRSIVITRNICRFCRSSSMLIEAGLTLPQTLKTVIGITDSDTIKQAFIDIYRDLMKGKGLSQPMARSNLFPKLLIDMVNIGEETGSLQSSFNTMADFYEKKLDQKVQRILAMIEPASIIVVGLIISLIGVAIISPLYSIYQNLN
jgi:type IV pilus assembly protein PilC